MSVIKSINYRPDIDGLRAIAVISVVLYHFFPGRFPGGFIGVDIFFVISGYLISLILFDNFEHDSFSYIEFYKRRILRIFPALSIVFIFVLAAGWFILANNDYALLGKHIISGASFLSNFVLASEAGYFDSSALSKPLLHLWSLAVEEQFYILWPIVIGLFWKRRTNFLTIVLFIAIASFLFNIINIASQPTMVFYYPFSRFWELMIGGVLAYLTLHKTRYISKFPNVQSIAGLTLLIAGFYLLNDTKVFPGYWAIMPCLGAFLLISGQGSWINRKILSNKIFVAVGLISYPLYLWHWPLLSLASISIYNINLLFIKIKILLICTSFLLSWMTYKFIEKPIRNNKSHKNLIAILLCVFVAVLACAGVGVFKYQGFPNRLGDRGNYMAYFQDNPPFRKYSTEHNIFKDYRVDCDFFDVKEYLAGRTTQVPRASIPPSCYTRGKNSKNAIFIWGDSHAQALYYGLENTLPRDISILQVASSGCHPDIVESVQSGDNYCKVSNSFALQKIKEEQPDIVIVAQYKGHDINKTREVVTKLKKNGIKKIMVIGPDPSWDPSLYKVIATEYWINTPTRIKTNLDLGVMLEEREMQKSIRATDDFQYVSLINFFCNKDGCLTYLNNDKKNGIITFDYGHLTPVASTYLAKNLLTPTILKDLNWGN
jgi:peptidoglycan/LPS O-acetylase OafA/YrhL